MNLAIRMRGVTLISRKAILNDKNHDICAALLQVHILRSDSHAHLHFSFSLTSTYILSYNRCLNLPLTVLYTYRHTQTHNFIITLSQSLSLPLSFYFTHTNFLSHAISSVMIGTGLIQTLYYSHSLSYCHSLSLTHFALIHHRTYPLIISLSRTHTHTL